METLLRTFFSVAGLQVIGKALAFLSAVVLARVLGPDNYGVYSYILSIVAIAMLPIVAGLPSFIIREVAIYNEEKKYELLSGLVTWSRRYIIILSFFLLATAYVLSLFDRRFEYIAFCMLIIPLKGMVIQKGAIINGLNHPVLAQLPNVVIVPLFSTIIIFSLYYFGVNITVDIAISVLFLSLVLSLLTATLLTKWKLPGQLKMVKPSFNNTIWIRSIIPFSAMTFMASLNAEVASPILGLLVSKESVAYYKVAIQAVALVALGLSSINSILMPSVARSYKLGDMFGSQELITQSVRLSTLISMPIIFILIFFGDFLINYFFGVAYNQAYYVLVVLCVGQLINVMMGSVGTILCMTGNEKSAIKTLLFALILNVFLLLLLSPKYGEIGAAISVSTSLIVWNFLMAIDVYKLTRLKTWIR